MILPFFNRTKSINLVLMSLLLSLTLVVSVIFFEKYTYSLPWLFEIILKWIILISGLVVFKIATIDNDLSNKTDFDILLYVILYSIFSIRFIDNDYFYSFFFLLLSFRKIQTLSNENTTKSIVFDSGFWIGVSAIFNPILCLYILVLLFAIAIFSKATWRTVSIAFFGLLTPLVLYYSYLFLMNKSIAVLNFPSVQFNFKYYFTNQFMIPLVSMGLIILLSLFKISQSIATFSLYVKKNTHVLFFHLGLTLILLFFYKRDSNILLLLIYPISIIVSTYLQLIQKKWLKNMIFYSVLIVLIITKIL